MVREGPLTLLLRGDLDTASFVRDYVEFRIDYSVLRCMTGPIVRIGGNEWRFPDPGSRDALCGLIGGIVKEVEVTDAAIELRMDLERTLILPLDAKSRALPDGQVSPEAVHLVPADERGSLDVARSGSSA